MKRLAAATLVVALVGCGGDSPGAGIDPAPIPSVPDACTQVVPGAHHHHGAAAHHEDPDVFAARHATARAHLERLAPPARPACLRRLLLAPELDTRELAVILLAGELQRGASDASGLAADRDPAIRAGAVLAFASYAPSRHRDAVLDAIEDPAPTVRAAAIASLRGLADRSAEALAAIDVRLDDPAPEVRAEAVATLGVLGSAAARARIATLLDDPDEAVRVRARYALRNLDNPGAK